MCSYDVKAQMKVFSHESNVRNSRQDAIQRLHSIGVVDGKGQFTSKYKFLAADKK